MPRASGPSLWTDTLPAEERFERAATGVPAHVDVAVIGAGYTGLWTAWHLRRIDPTLRIAVIERDHVGFGASGRNGGWASSLLPMSLASVAREHGDATARRLQATMHDTVGRIGDWCRVHAHDGTFHQGGSISMSRLAPHTDRLRGELDELRRFGFDEDDYRWLDATAASEVCGATGVLGGLTTPHCAVVHPARLVHALANAVHEAGVTIVERAAVERHESERVDTSAGSIRAEVVVRATEGYTPQLAGERRTVMPLYSLMVATEPLPPAVWDEIGLADRSTFADGRSLIIYGQRTSDDRIAFGGRGAPYHFGSRIDPEFDRDDRIRGLLTDELRALFPALADARITHHWGGVLAVPRDRHPSVAFDRTTGIATVGGYVGDGVTTSYAAGRTLAALIAGPADEVDADHTRLPWVGHRSRRWEPEPLRWLGVNAALLAARRGDRRERRTERPARLWNAVFQAIQGH